MSDINAVLDRRREQINRLADLLEQLPGMTRHIHAFSYTNESCIRDCAAPRGMGDRIWSASPPVSSEELQARYHRTIREVEAEFILAVLQPFLLAGDGA